jgi:hypothetical protein
VLDRPPRLIRVLGDVRAANQMSKQSQTHLCAPADSKPRRVASDTPAAEGGHSKARAAQSGPLWQALRPKTPRHAVSCAPGSADPRRD